jgi:hypothetical protein
MDMISRGKNKVRTPVTTELIRFIRALGTPMGLPTRVLIWASDRRKAALDGVFHDRDESGHRPVH